MANGTSGPMVDPKGFGGGLGRAMDGGLKLNPQFMAGLSAAGLDPNNLLAEIQQFLQQRLAQMSGQGGASGATGAMGQTAAGGLDDDLGPDLPDWQRDRLRQAMGTIRTQWQQSAERDGTGARGRDIMGLQAGQSPEDFAGEFMRRNTAIEPDLGRSLMMGSSVAMQPGLPFAGMLARAALGIGDPFGVNEPRFNPQQLAELRRQIALDPRRANDILASARANVGRGLSTGLGSSLTGTAGRGGISARGSRPANSIRGTGSLSPGTGGRFVGGAGSSRSNFSGGAMTGGSAFGGGRGMGSYR